MDEQDLRTEVSTLILSICLSVIIMIFSSASSLIESQRTSFGASVVLRPVVSLSSKVSYCVFSHMSLQCFRCGGGSGSAMAWEAGGAKVWAAACDGRQTVRDKSPGSRSLTTRCG